MVCEKQRAVTDNAVLTLIEVHRSEIVALLDQTMLLSRPTQQKHHYDPRL